jgi:hypothetical protein
MMEDLTNADDKFNKIHKHLQKIPNNTITDHLFNSMLHKNILSSSSTLSAVLWTIFVISLSALLLLGCWYCNTLCRSHARLWQICHCNKEPEAGTPLCPLYSNAPLFRLEKEDMEPSDSDGNRKGIASIKDGLITRVNFAVRIRAKIRGPIEG